MSNELQTSEVVDNITAFITKQQDHFVDLNKHCLVALDFGQECEFAKQQLTKNDYTLGVARENPDSLHAAISNIAAIGITLNPAMQFAYLVPRDKAITLDISYRGMIKLATDTGIIKAMKAELIYENDTFEYYGFHKEPKIVCDPFAVRGALRGVYAMALMNDGTVLVETMTADEVCAIRNDSKAYISAVKAGGWKLEQNVWVKYFGEMVKKTVIKRCFKTIPTSGVTNPLGAAIEVLNDHEGIDFDRPEPEVVADKITFSDAQLAEYRRCIEENDFFNLSALTMTLDPQIQMDLHKLCVPEAPQGQKMKAKQAFSDSLTNGRRQLEATRDLLFESLTEDADDEAVLELLEAANPYARDYLLERLNLEHTIRVSEILAVAESIVFLPTEGEVE